MINLPLNNKNKKAKFTANSYAHLRSSDIRNPSKIEIFLKNLRKNFTIGRKVRDLAIIIIIPLVLVILIVGFALTSDLFQVKKINFVGSDIDQEHVSFLQGKNIFTFSAGSIESLIRSKDENIEYVLVRKILPDEVEIEVKLVKADIVLYSLNSFNLLNSKGSVIKSGYYEFGLSDFDKNLLNNKIDFNSDILKQQYLLKLKPEEVPKFDWDKVPTKDKQSLLDRNKEIALKKIASFKENILKEVGKLKLDKSVLKIFFNRFETKEIFDEEKRIEIVKQIKELSTKEKFKIKEIEWSSLLTLKMVTDKNATLLFSYDRNLSDQLFDLRSVIWNNKLKKGKTIDLRTDNFQIR